MIENFAQANQRLEGYIPSSTPQNYTLDNMRWLMDYLGNPQDNLRIIHVAGTSGKTSTSYFVAALLKASGKRVGLSVSPHIDQINERVQIDLEPLPEKGYCLLLNEFLDLVEQSGLNPSYFEVLVAFAFWVFSKQNVDYAVMEVGLGGLLDGTNVVNREDKVCVITDIGLDHTNILGKTVTEIAEQKAGIIQPGNQVFVHSQLPNIIEVIQQNTDRKNAHLKIISNQLTIAPKNVPQFQLRNFGLAMEVYEYLRGKDHLTELDQKQLDQAIHVYIPARMEEIKYGKKTIILDGSHNQQKLQALVSSIQSKFPNNKIILLVSFGQNKQAYIKEALVELSSLSTTITLTSFHLGQDEPRKPIDPTGLSNVCRSIGFRQIEIQPDPVKAFEAALSIESDILVVTGSFYLLNHIRPLVR